MKTLFYSILVCSLSGTIAGAAILLFRRLTEKLISPGWKCIMWAIPVLLLLVPFKIPLNLGSGGTFQLSNTVAITNVKELPGYFSSTAGDQTTQTQRPGSTKEQTAGNGSLTANTQQNVQASGKPTVPNQQQRVRPAVNQLSAVHIVFFILNSILPAIWLLGLAAMLAFMLLSTIRLNRNIKRTSAGAADEKILGIAARCSHIMKLKKPLNVILQSHIKTSALVGVFHPRIVLPAYATGLDEETLKYIILHELSHFKRRDMIINYLLLIVQAVHWFNPFVWYCFKNIRQDMELATDTMVLAHLQDPEHPQYALSLLKVIAAEQGLGITPKLLCMADSPKNIKRRIGMIKLHGLFKKRTALASVSCALIMVLAGTMFFTVKPGAAAGSNSNPLNSPVNSTTGINQASSTPTATSSKNPIQLTADPSAAVADSGSPASSRFDSLYFLNDTIGWVIQGSTSTSDGFRLLSTTDGGNNWSEVYNGTLDFKKVNFISRQVGWAVVQTGDNLYSIHKTTDGGKTWVKQSESTVSGNGNYNVKVKFSDLNNGYAFLCDKLLKTTDSGNTWTDITPANGTALTDCSFVSAVNIWVCGTVDGNIVALNTTDGGGSWTQKFRLTSSDTDLTAPSKIDFISKKTGWILLDNTPGSSKPTLYNTTDGGNSFTGICNVAGNRPYPADLCFADSNIGFVGTDHGAGPISGGLMMTADGGKTFNYIINDIGGIDSIVFPSQKVGYALGYNDNNVNSTGFIIGTTDGGKSWHQLSKIAPAIGISFVDGKNGFGIGIGSDAGAFLKTIDGGVTWSYVYSFSPKCLYTAGVSFVSKTTGYVIASPPDGDSLVNDLYKTTDGGKSWAAVGKVSVYCDYFKMFDENNGIASGLSSGSITYSKTKDGGKTWTRIPINTDGDKIVSDFSSPEQGIVTHFDYRTQTVTFKDFSDDNADNTIATYPDTEMGCSSIYVYGNKVIALMAVGQSSGYSEAIIISNDGGRTWKQVPISAKTGDILVQVGNSIRDTCMNFPNAKDGFIMVPGYSSLLYTTDGGDTWSWN